MSQISYLREVLKYSEPNENKNTTEQILWNAVEELHIGKFIAEECYKFFMAREDLKPTNLSFHIQKLERELIKSKASRRNDKQSRNE